MNKTNTDLRELLDRLSVYVEPKTIKEFEGVCRFYIKRDYLPRTEAISRKDAVGKSEVMELIERNRFSVFVGQADKVVTAVKYLPLRNLLTEVDKPNKA